MEGPDALYRLGIALAIGLLVGAERHWREREEVSGRRTAGVRTFGITGLLGGIAGALAMVPPLAGTMAGPLLIGLAFLGYAVAVLVFKLREAESEGRFSVTSVVAAQATFLLGAMATLGEAKLAGAGAVILTAVLASRESLHGFMTKLRWVELRSAILLLSMTLVALPLIPDRAVNVLGGLNLARIWMLAVILGAVSFLGYAAVRMFGDHLGRLLAGAATGLVSSTAATLTNARAASANPAGALPLAVGALAAGAVSCLRTGALAWAMAPAMGIRLAPALLAAALVQGLAMLAVLRHGRQTPAPEAGGNPFELRAVLQMAGLLALVGLLGQWAATRFGDAGIFAVAGLTALADVDAVTLTMAEMVPAALAAETAAAAVALAVGVNLLAKAAYGLALGGLRFGLAFGGVSLAALVAGAVALWAAG